MPALLIQTSPTQTPPTLVTIAGEIDIASAPALRRHLLSLPEFDTVLELSWVKLLSGAALTELVDLRDRLAQADARLALAATSPSARRVLAITGLDDTMLLADTLDEAVHLVATAMPQRPRTRPRLSLVSPTRSCGVRRP